MRQGITIVLLLLFAVPASALQVGDGQYNNMYNDQDLAATQVRFNNITTKGAGGGVPVGTIIAWPAASNPEDMENWLECNGQAVNAAMYPELRAVIGANVPDLRGLFLRGVGGNSAALGVQQGDAIRETASKGHFYACAHGDETRNPHLKATGIFSSEYSGTWFHHGYGPTVQSGYKFTLDLSKLMPVADEIRPQNMAVRYLIRALP